MQLMKLPLSATSLPSKGLPVSSLLYIKTRITARVCRLKDQAAGETQAVQPMWSSKPRGVIKPLYCSLLCQYSLSSCA